jgi:hypothetical protein
MVAMVDMGTAGYHLRDRTFGEDRPYDPYQSWFGRETDLILNLVIKHQLLLICLTTEKKKTHIYLKCLGSCSHPLFIGSI